MKPKEKQIILDLGSIHLDEEGYQELNKIGFTNWIKNHADCVEIDQIIIEEE